MPGCWAEEPLPGSQLDTWSERLALRTAARFEPAFASRNDFDGVCAGRTADDPVRGDPTVALNIRELSPRPTLAKGFGLTTAPGDSARTSSATATATTTAAGTATIVAVPDPETA